MASGPNCPKCKKPRNKCECKSDKKKGNPFGKKK